MASWWFQPIWKILKSKWKSSWNRGEHRKCLKPPPRRCVSVSKNGGTHRHNSCFVNPTSSAECPEKASSVSFGKDTLVGGGGWIFVTPLSGSLCKTCIYIYIYTYRKYHSFRQLDGGYCLRKLSSWWKFNQPRHGCSAIFQGGSLKYPCSNATVRRSQAGTHRIHGCLV